MLAVEEAFSLTHMISLKIVSFKERSFNIFQSLLPIIVYVKSVHFIISLRLLPAKYRKITEDYM